MNEEIKVLFIEDDPNDAERYAQLLTERGKIKVTSIFPPKHVDELCLSPPPDLILIDYRLTQLQPSGDSASYRGGTLANYIVEQNPRIPLITFSTRDVLNSFPNYEQEIQSVDYVLYKGDVNQDSTYWRNFLILLVQGYRKLVESSPITWKCLMQLLKTTSSEEEDLQRSSPPHKKDNESFSIHSVVKWILRVLFRYPGIFYDSLYASTILGIKEEDFLKEEVQTFFQDSYYSSIFANIKKLWWRNRLQGIAFRCIRDAELTPILSGNFLKAFGKKTGIKLNPSECIFSGELNANTVCCILKKPVKMKYTLGYLMDDRPESMDPARISFKAILEEDIDENLIPRADAERLDDIRRSYKY